MSAGRSRSSQRIVARSVLSRATRSENPTSPTASSRSRSATRVRSRRAAGIGATTRQFPTRDMATWASRAISSTAEASERSPVSISICRSGSTRRSRTMETSRSGTGAWNRAQRDPFPGPREGTLKCRRESTLRFVAAGQWLGKDDRRDPAARPTLPPKVSVSSRRRAGGCKNPVWVGPLSTGKGAFRTRSFSSNVPFPKPLVSHYNQW